MRPHLLQCVSITAQHAELHKGHKAGSPALQCTAESKACLLCKALCGLMQLLHGFRHSAASAHAACLHNCTACRAYERMYIHTGHKAGCPALQCTAESTACLLCEALCGLICLLHSFRHSTASAHAVCLNNCTVSITAQHAEHMKGCMFTKATKQGPRHCNALLRVRLVWCAKHYAASFACCIASGTAQLKFDITSIRTCALWCKCLQTSNDVMTNSCMMAKQLW